MSFDKNLHKIQFKVDHLSLLRRIGLFAGLLITLFLVWWGCIYRPLARDLAVAKEKVATAEGSIVNPFRAICLVS